jgi:hypothetical protein
LSKEGKKSNEFRRYRQVLVGIYVGTVAAGAVLLFASVANELLFRRTATKPSAASLSGTSPPDTATLLGCHHDVLRLLTELGTRTCEAVQAPIEGRDPSQSAWAAFEQRWHAEWARIDASCGFSELADTNLGVAYDRLAKVHGDLPQMGRKFRSLLVQFDDEQAAELARMRRALDQSEKALRKRLGATD